MVHSPSAHTHRATVKPVVGWQTMESAPKDRPILGWCVHDADPYFIEPEDGSGRSRLTLYGGHTEGLSHVSDGPHVIEWGGAWDDRNHEYDGGWMPDWWFRSDSEFEVTANPVLWMDIHPPLMRLLVDQEWMERRVEADPDLPCEATTASSVGMSEANAPTTPPVKTGEG